VLLVEDIQGLELLKVLLVEDIQGQVLLQVLEDIQVQEFLQALVEDIQGQELLQVLLVEDIQGRELLVGDTLGPVVLLVGDIPELEHLLVEDIKEQELLKADMVELQCKWTLMWPSGSKLLTKITVAKLMPRSLDKLWPMAT